MPYFFKNCTYSSRSSAIVEGSLDRWCLLLPCVFRELGAPLPWEGVSKCGGIPSSKLVGVGLSRFEEDGVPGKERSTRLPSAKAHSKLVALAL